MPSNRKPLELSPPPPISASSLPIVLLNWFNQVFDRVGNGPFMIQGYSRVDLIGSPAKVNPADWATTDPASAFTSLVFVYDETSGTPCLAYSDGTDWRRVHDNAIVA